MSKSDIETIALSMNTSLTTEADVEAWLVEFEKRHGYTFNESIKEDVMKTKDICKLLKVPVKDKESILRLGIPRNTLNILDFKKSVLDSANFKSITKGGNYETGMIGICYFNYYVDGIHP